ncbi:MAG: hypothetical protein WC365_07665 [Candidatus Babeliales bacterium]|jgi:hypothetical protein
MNTYVNITVNKLYPKDMKKIVLQGTPESIHPEVLKFLMSICKHPKWNSNNKAVTNLEVTITSNTVGDSNDV